MTSEQRAREIAELKKLLNEVEAMAHYQIWKLGRLRSLVARVERASEQVEPGEGPCASQIIGVGAG